MGQGAIIALYAISVCPPYRKVQNSLFILRSIVRPSSTILRVSMLYFTLFIKILASVLLFNVNDRSFVASTLGLSEYALDLTSELYKSGENFYSCSFRLHLGAIHMHC